MPFVSPSLCYIRRMLLDHQLALETIAKPRSFIGLMCLYESNYFRLQQLIPEIERLDGCYQSCVAGDCDLHVEIIERSRYTVTLSLSYFFYELDRRIADPAMKVRVYLDAQLAEAMSLRGDHRNVELKRLSRIHGRELDERWRHNIFLSKWLEYLIDQGHLVLER